MQDENKSTVQRILNFAEDKGFYIILGLCVMAIGVSGYVLFFTGEPGGLPDPLTMEEPGAAITAPVTVPTTVPEATRPQATQPAESTQPAEEVPVVRPTQVAIPSTQVANPTPVEQPKTVMPAQGAVSRPFSGDELVEDPTMGDWRVHRGVDIDCEAGTPVVAMMAGTVSDVFTHPMMGYCVSVTHEDDLVSTYCGLAVNESVKVGQAVKAGTAIGKAGNTVLAESGQASHIHVELTRGGVHIDPLSLLE